MTNGEFPPGRPSFISRTGGRTRLEHEEISEAFGDHLRFLRLEGWTIQALADRYDMTIHPIWYRIQKSRERAVDPR